MVGPGHPVYYVTRWMPPVLRPDAAPSDWKLVEVVGAFSSRVKAQRWLELPERRDAHRTGHLRLEQYYMDELLGVRRGTGDKR